MADAPTQTPPSPGGRAPTAPDTPGHGSRTAWEQRWTRRRVALIAILLVTVIVVANGISTGQSTLAVVGILAFVIGCAVGGYTDNWIWTGIGPFTHHKTDAEEYVRGKTLWDVLQLLIVPAVLSLGVIWFNDRQNAASQEKAQIQAWDTILDNYLTQISDLMLKDRLGGHDTPAVRAIARARTLTALSRLDAARRALLVRFLSESKLVQAVSLSIAPLSRVNLSGIDLSCAHPSRARAPDIGASRAYPTCAHLTYAWFADANLSFINLSYADLAFADVSGADLAYANLSGANLGSARLSGVTWDHTVCPDGTNSHTNHTSPESCAGHLVPVGS